MKDDHDDDHKELAINLRTTVAKIARTLNLPASRHILSMALSGLWRIPGRVGTGDEKIHQKRRARALFLPRT